jgi:hypothetical protein
MSNQPGLTLADLAAMSEDVAVGDRHITVYGISAMHCLAIFKRFPKLVSMLSGFNLATFLDAAPDAAAAILAAGVGQMGSPAAEADAAKIGIELQYDMLEAIGRLTFKSGFAPFVDRVMKLAGNVQGSANSGREQATRSPPVSKPSSQPDTPQT